MFRLIRILITINLPDFENGSLLKRNIFYTFIFLCHPPPILSSFWVFVYLYIRRFKRSCFYTFPCVYMRPSSPSPSTSSSFFTFVSSFCIFFFCTFVVLCICLSIHSSLRTFVLRHVWLLGHSSFCTFVPLYFPPSRSSSFYTSLCFCTLVFLCVRPFVPSSFYTIAFLYLGVFVDSSFCKFTCLYVRSLYTFDLLHVHSPVRSFLCTFFFLYPHPSVCISVVLYVRLSTCSPFCAFVLLCFYVHVRVCPLLLHFPFSVRLSFCTFVRCHFARLLCLPGALLPGHS